MSTRIAGLPWSWRPSRRAAIAASAILAVATTVAALAHVSHFEPPGAQPWIDYALALAGSLPLALLYRRPLAVCSIVVASDLAVWFFRPSWTMAGALVLPVVIYAATSRHGRPVAAVSWLVCATGLATATAVVAPVFLADGTWVVVALLAAVGAIAGDAAHARRRWHAHDRAARQRRAALEERLRLSRDLHDVVGHHLTAIALQADAATRRLQHDAAAHAGASEPTPTPADPASADAVTSSIPPAANHFAVVADTARTALAETRRLIAYLRQGTDHPTADQPGIDELPQLIAEALRDGLIVDLHTTAPAAVPPAIGLAAYRVVQEALTNVRKHSGAPTARVEISGPPELLTIRVADSGPAAEATTRTGFGLTGLRERVEAQGGQLLAGPRDSGGFEVLASIPLTSGP
ncbi:sensor histidine kinase [Stackebrandtia nassauensis]|uniref:sensor histidine kinase n=1 Tax=Stackebrandtia nassauensis TaxID=283811 RepID=UPI0001A399FE|nr:histidine kinase [Stackebrandtia nassauensis]